MRLIPAIDIIEGKCVRLTKGDYATKKIYDTDPVDVAKRFEDHGIRYLHLVDLDGAASQHIVNYKTLEKIAAQTNLKIDFGGGLKSDDDLRIAFESGASQVTGGSIAVKQMNTFLQWLEKWGQDKIILGADVKEEKLAVSGWKEETGVDLLPFVEYYHQQGVKYLICTDISKDGMLEGPSFDLYNKILKAVPDIRLIASGGVSSLADVEKLAGMRVDGVIIGKALYEQKITLKELERFL